MTDVEHLSKESAENRPTPSFLAQLGLRRLSEAASNENTLFKKTGDDNNANREFLEEVMGDKFKQIDISAEESASMSDSCDEFEQMKMAAVVTAVPTKARPKLSMASSKGRGSKLDAVKLNAYSHIELNDVGKRLHNLLKLPLAHRWIVCEFLYSDIDRSIFEMSTSNSLNPAMLNRQKWRLLRGAKGRPRRLSPMFLLRERIELEYKRRLIRRLQQHKFEGIKNTGIVVDLPSEVPLTLSADTKVCVRLDLQDFGIQFGIVAGYQTKTGIYYVNMMNKDLGMRRVPDFKVYNLQPTKMITVSNIIRQIDGGISDRTDTIGDGILRGDPSQQNECPMKTLKALVHLETLACIKSGKILRLTQMNDIFEQQQANELRQPTTHERDHFQRRYVRLMIELHKLNSAILEPLNVMHDYMSARNREGKDEQYFSSIELLNKCRSTTVFAFEREMRLARINTTSNYGLVKSFHTLLTIGTYLNGKNTTLVFAAIDILVAELSADMSPDMAGQLQNMVAKYLKPLSEQILQEDEKAQSEPKDFEVLTQYAGENNENLLNPLTNININSIAATVGAVSAD